MKPLKFLVAIALLPACAAATLTARDTAIRLLPTATTTPSLAFTTGYATWLLIFLLLPKPTRAYILGHELTHAFWALLMGGRIRKIEVRKTRGSVQTTKINWFIALAPYFFPFYAMLSIALFFIVHWLVDLTRWFWLLFALVGAGWSFHVTFTLMLLFTVAQPDLKSQGYIFSLVIIYLMNILTLLATATALSPDLSFATFAASLCKNTLHCYGWTLDNIHLLWQHLTHAISR